MATHAELRKEANKVKEILEQQIDFINSLSKEEIEKIALEKFPELLKQEEQQTSTEEDVDFIRTIINEDLKTNKYNGRVHTRFPPEPNGYLHIGHAKSINLNYGLAEEYKGKFNLRFDDTNPTTEEMEYVEGIIEDVKWLGGNFEDRLLYASDYFDQFYEYAVQLVKKGLAYVDDQSLEEMRKNRGSATEPGVDSPYRNRTIEENLDLFTRMKDGEFPDGSKVLRAKIDMQDPNLLLRDPVIYRIIHAPHHNTGNKWCIYPMYDWAHGLEDSIEGITHSICTLEFVVHRPLYDWFLDNLDDENGKPIFHPQQIEFARLNISNTVLSKRKMLHLVKEGYVNGWDDPRMLTIVGLKRRGITAEAIRKFCKVIGVTKRDTIIDISVLNKCVRDDLNKTCPRIMSVLEPLKVVITNLPEDEIIDITVPNHPKNKKMGTRKVKFSRTLFIEQEDFMEKPTKDFYRLSPGKEVRLKYAYVITCDKVIKDKKTGKVSEIHCRYKLDTKSGESKDDKIHQTIHWISEKNAVEAEVRLYYQLFTKVNPLDTEEGKDFTDYINPDSLKIVKAYVEPHLQKAEKGSRYQFERKGFFNIDPIDSKKNALVFNQTIPLRDSKPKK